MHRAAFVGDHVLQIRIAIIGRGLELAAERGLRIGEDHGNERLAVDAHEKRLVVREKLREQRDDEQHHEDPERPVAAPVGLEVLPAAPVDGRHHERAPRGRHIDAHDADRSRVRRIGGAGIHAHTSRVSKSMRGSTQV
jgi:hypothetical protein